MAFLTLKKYEPDQRLFQNCFEKFHSKTNSSCYELFLLQLLFLEGKHDLAKPDIEQDHEGMHERDAHIDSRHGGMETSMLSARIIACFCQTKI